MFPILKESAINDWFFMYSICYVSAASRHMSKEELLGLMDSCHKNNEAIDVTGLLLYNGNGTFIQVLEGEQAIVQALYDKISLDSRHHRVNCIGRQSIEARSFPNWSMGFKLLEEEDLTSIEGYTDFLESKDSTTYLTSDTSFAFSLISHFKETAVNT